MITEDSLLTVSNLSVKIGEESPSFYAVNNVSFELNDRETVALIGESGSGKSMTALAIMRLLPPAARFHPGASITLRGENVLHLTETEMRKIRGRRIAMIFQEPMTSLNPVLTVATQIGEVLSQHFGLHGLELKQRILELLDAVKIPEAKQRMNSYPHQLSGGMKQRIMIAMALAGEPDLLIADEPTTALDVTIQAQILVLLKELQQAMNMGLLLVSHDLGVVAEVADKTLVMYQGEIVEQGVTSTFIEKPKHPYSKKLLSAALLIEKKPTTLITDSGFNQGGSLIDESMRHRKMNSPVALVSDNEKFEKSNIEKPILSVENLKLYYPIRKGLFKRKVAEVKAVDDVSFRLEKGKTLAIVGESGCGKTSLAKAILQLEKATSGKVLLNDTDLLKTTSQKLRSLRQQLQMVFQDPFSSMNPRMLVGDILAEGIVNLKTLTDKSQIQSKIETLLEQVGLPKESQYRYPHEFSGGQRQRICIARALALNPEVIICDEPTSALDVSIQAQIINLLKALQDKQKLSYLFISHNLSVVGYLADTVAVMYLGRVVEVGKTQEVLTQPKHPYTQALMSAVPSLDKQKRERIILKGELPSPINPPKGCHFHPRCPHAKAICRQQYPKKTAISAKQEVVCFLYE